MIVSSTKENIGILITNQNVRKTPKIVDRAYLIYGGEILCHGVKSFPIACRESN
jgi:ABC-type lipopolysaccharide export system ATPase subunit